MILFTKLVLIMILYFLPFRVEGGEYNSHFIVNEEDFTKVNLFYS